jgi:hypothetical protein
VVPALSPELPCVGVEDPVERVLRGVYEAAIGSALPGEAPAVFQADNIGEAGTLRRILAGKGRRHAPVTAKSGAASRSVVARG